MTTPTYDAVNRAGWNGLSRTTCDSSQICEIGALRCAQQILDPGGWLPWDRLRRVLCLASGGGQQGPMFAALGYQVTVADLSAGQLALDAEAADRYGLVIERLECDVLDLSPLADRRFDLVYQPVSTLYLPDVRRCYRQVASVLRPGGLYWSEHWNPVEMQLDPETAWDGLAYRLSIPQRAGPLPAPAGSTARTAVCWHYIHSLEDLVGGICDAGFAIRRLRERPGADLGAVPGTRAHLGAYVPAFFSVLAERLAVAPQPPDLGVSR